MKVLILGAGVIGVTAAEALAARGHEVEIVDRGAGCGSETSFANGGQLSFSHGEPWATPQILPKVLKWMFRKDAPLVFHLRWDPDMINWCFKFLAECTFAASRRNAENTLRLGLYSRQRMKALISAIPLPFDHETRGVLHLFSNAEELERAALQAEFQKSLGCPFELLDRRACITKEPVLAKTSRAIAGGIFMPWDETGDAAKFTLKLGEYLESSGKTRFHYRTTVQKIHAEAGRITGVETSKGMMKADAYMMALGSYSPIYLKPLGIHLPIYPLKGYSFTVPANAHTPAQSLTDGLYKMVYSRLGDRLRIAGTAETSGYDLSIPESRMRPLLRAASELLPGAIPKYDEISHEWACLRPSTPQGTPYLGKTSYANLYMNTGHGTLGWTLAAGSATILADVIENKTPHIDLTGFLCP